MSFRERGTTVIAGMSIGSWILIIVLALWAFVAVKVYFFGGFKKDKKKGLSVGSCCETGDNPCSGCSCTGCQGCTIKATRTNAVLPEFKVETK